MDEPIKPETQDDPQGLLYHYTTQAGLIGILRSKSIWATHFQYLNDTSEGQIVSNAILDEISSRSDSSDAFHKLGLAGNAPKNTAESSRDDVLTQGFVAAVWATSQNAFVTSFSERGDSLSQWRAYSGQSVGYSLGFRPDHLRSIGLQFLTGRSDIFSRSDPLGRCKYYDKRTEDSLKSQVRQSVDAYFRQAELSAGLPIAQGTEGFRSNAAIALGHFIQLGKLSVTYKAAGFSEEEEWRLAFLLHQDSIPADIELRPGSSTLVPYIEVPLVLKEVGMGLDEIKVGPCPHPDESVKAVEMLLFRYGVKGVQVSRSQIPYRNW